MLERNRDSDDGRPKTVQVVLPRSKAKEILGGLRVDLRGHLDVNKILKTVSDTTGCIRWATMRVDVYSVTLE